MHYLCLSPSLFTTEIFTSASRHLSSQDAHNGFKYRSSTGIRMMTLQSGFMWPFLYLKIISCFSVYNFTWKHFLYEIYE